MVKRLRSKLYNSEGTPYNGIYGEGLGSTLFMLQVLGKVRVSLVEVYESGRLLSFWSIKKPKRTRRCILWL